MKSHKFGFGVIAEDAKQKYIAYGTSVPTDGTSGYAPGALFFHTDGSGILDRLYQNIGTLSSCNFDVIGQTAGMAITDSGNLIAAGTVEGALQELAQHQQTSQAFLNLPLGAWTEQDGTTLADFSDGASPTPGWNAGDDSFGIRWNNHATPDPITTSIPIPPDLDDSEDVVLHLLCAKTGATSGDTVNWTVEAFNNADGALYDADSDFGGECDGITGDATAKTVQESTLTLASADVEGAPCILTLTVQPKDGKLGTDDVILLGAWLEYTRKTLTS